MTDRNSDTPLPPRPGEIIMPAENKDVPIVVYINGQPVQMAKAEALGAVAQIAQILLYLEGAKEEVKKNNGAGN